MTYQAKFAAILLVVLVSSCNVFRAKEPCEEYIDRATMESLLKDVFLLEAYLNTHSYRPRLRDSVSYYYAGILRYHGVDAALFEQAMRCYLLQSEQITAVLDNILSALSIAQSKLDMQTQPKSPVDETIEYYGYPHYW